MSKQDDKAAGGVTQTAGNGDGHVSLPPIVARGGADREADDGPMLSDRGLLKQDTRAMRDDEGENDLEEIDIGKPDKEKDLAYLKDSSKVETNRPPPV